MSMHALYVWFTNAKELPTGISSRWNSVRTLLWCSFYHPTHSYISINTNLIHRRFNSIANNNDSNCITLFMHRWLQLTALHIQAYKLEMCPMCANIFHNRKIMKYAEKKNWINEFHMRLTSMPQYRQDISNYRFMLESSWTS